MDHSTDLSRYNGPNRRFLCRCHRPISLPLGASISSVSGPRRRRRRRRYLGFCGETLGFRGPMVRLNDEKNRMWKKKKLNENPLRGKMANTATNFVREKVFSSVSNDDHGRRPREAPFCALPNGRPPRLFVHLFVSVSKDFVSPPDSFHRSNARMRKKSLRVITRFYRNYDKAVNNYESIFFPYWLIALYFFFCLVHFTNADEPKWLQIIFKSRV